MCIFGNICTPSFRKPEFSWHSGVCDLKVAPFYCKRHQVASSRRSAVGKDRPIKCTTSYPSMFTPPSFELEFLRNQSFACVSVLWAVKALELPKVEKVPSWRVPAACLFYTEMCIFGHISTLISRQPEFSRHSGVCRLKVARFYCKPHQVACSRKTVGGKDVPVK